MFLHFCEMLFLELVELGWGGFDRAKLDMLILIRIPFSFHDY